MLQPYTQDQLERYFRHIEYSPKDAEDDLGRLATLQLHHMARVPFESLTLHYSKHHRLSLDLEDLFEKIVDKGRGGYCMEVNAFFGAVLHSLGYTLINVGGRVKAGDGEYKGWNHMVNIVTINNTRYLVDVGFGSNGSVHPVPLEHNRIFTTVSPVRGKLEYKSLLQHTDQTNQRIWVYSTQENESAPWKEMYCFAAAMEFFPADFEVMNLSTMTSPQSFFVQTVMCMWLLLNDDNHNASDDDDDRKERQPGPGSGPRPIGVLILHKDYVKRRIGDKSEIIEHFESEEQRVKALERYFGIVLTKKEREAIRGLPSELKTRCGHC